MAKKNLEERAIKGAVQSGLKEFFERNRYLLRGKEDELSNHVDKQRILAKIREMKKRTQGKGAAQLEPAFLYDWLKKYVASGSMFDLEGEKELIEKGLEKKAEGGFFSKIKSWFYYLTRPKEQRYFERTLNEANKVYQSFASNSQYKGITPQVKAYLTEVNALDALVKVMKDEKVITSNEAKEIYSTTAKNLEQRTERLKEDARKNLERLMQKTAASVLGILGFSLIVFNSKITGAVIGTGNRISSCIAGICVLLLSLLFVINLSRRQHLKNREGYFY